MSTWKSVIESVIFLLLLFFFVRDACTSLRAAPRATMGTWVSGCTDLSDPS